LVCSSAFRRNDAIKNGDRTPLACYRWRPAVDFVEPSFSLFGAESLSDKICGETPQITRQRRVLPFFNRIVTASGGFGGSRKRKTQNIAIDHFREEQPPALAPLTSMKHFRNGSFNQ
jgi:hypothetical protein